METEQSKNQSIKQTVMDNYGAAALRVIAGLGASCCGDGACDTSAPGADGKAVPANTKGPITAALYELSQVESIPQAAIEASLGCGNPTALAKLSEGEIVLDLGSGGGIDVLLSAKRVGPSGKAYGLDMTDAMLALARENQKAAGATNVEFLKGEIENIPLPDNTVDVIISNCVVNLSADKDRVLAESFRVLKPGGRLAISDVVVNGEVPPEVRKSMELWIGCIAGALEVEDFRAKIAAAGFTQIDIEPTRVYNPQDARGFLEKAGLDVDLLAASMEGKFMSAFVRAIKP